MGKSSVKTKPAGSNWEQLKKSLPASNPRDAAKDVKGKGREIAPFTGIRKPRLMGLTKFAHQADFVRSTDEAIAGPSKPTVVQEIDVPAHVIEGVVYLAAPSDKPLVNELRQMVSGRNHLSETKKAPGNYVAIDCEMVGLGHLGSESALARISIVNYHGHVLLDTFVQPREQVTDWRTWVSGVTEADLVGAPEFEDVQKQVAALVEGRILIGHAIQNDLKALLLTHPNPLVRDTQKFKPLRDKAKTKYPGLKRLVEMELGLQIQAGSHSSVTDARATMALYRLYKPEWEQILRRSTEAYLAKTGAPALGKRKRDAVTAANDGVADENEDNLGRPIKGMKKKPEVFPGGGRKGISSGLGLVVKRNGKRVEGLGRNGLEGTRRHEESSSGIDTGGNWWENSAAV